MSKHNYSQYSNKKNHNQAEAAVTQLNEDVESVSVVEETPVVPEVVESAVEPIVEPVVEPAHDPKTVEGTVVGCVKLNVRVKPNIYAAVVSVIDANDKVTIDPDESVKDWYKVRTANGIAGFCMRKFVNAPL